MPQLTPRNLLSATALTPRDPGTPRKDLPSRFAEPHIVGEAAHDDRASPRGGSDPKLRFERSHQAAEGAAQDHQRFANRSNAQHVVGRFAIKRRDSLLHTKSKVAPRSDDRKTVPSQVEPTTTSDIDPTFPYQPLPQPGDIVNRKPSCVKFDVSEDKADDVEETRCEGSNELIAVDNEPDNTAASAGPHVQLDVDLLRPLDSTPEVAKNYSKLGRLLGDSKKGLGMGGWALGMVLEFVFAVGVRATEAATYVVAGTALATAANLHDAYGAHKDKKTAKKLYKQALSDRITAYANHTSVAQTVLARMKEAGRDKPNAAEERLLLAARVTVELLDDVLKSYEEGYRSPADAKLLETKRLRELAQQTMVVDRITNRSTMDIDDDREMLKRILRVPAGADARRAAMGQCERDIEAYNAEIAGKEAALKQLQGQADQQDNCALVEAELAKLTADRQRAEDDLTLLTQYFKQTRLPRLIREDKNLGHKDLKKRRDFDLTVARQVLEVPAAVASTIAAMATGVASIASAVPGGLGALLAPLAVWSGRHDVHDAHRERRKASADVTAALNKIDRARAVLRQCESLPDGPEARVRKRAATASLKSALREYKVAKILQRTSMTRRFKGWSVIYFGAPASVFSGACGIAALASLYVVLDVATLGAVSIAALVMAGVSLTVPALFYGRLGGVAQERRKNKNRDKDDEAVLMHVLKVLGQHGPQRLLSASDDEVDELIKELKMGTPVRLHKRLAPEYLLSNRYLVSSFVGQDLHEAATTLAPDVASKTVAAQVAKDIGVSDERLQYLLGNHQLLVDTDQQPDEQKHIDSIAITVANSLGVKIYGAERLRTPAVAASIAESQEAFKKLKDNHEGQQLAPHELASPDQDELVQQYRDALREQLGIHRGDLIELKKWLKSDAAAQMDLGERTSLQRTVDALLAEPKRSPSLAQPSSSPLPHAPLTIASLRTAVQTVGSTYATGRRKKLHNWGFPGSERPLGTAKDVLKAERKHRDEHLIGNLVSTLRDMLPRDGEGQIIIPQDELGADLYANGDAYLQHLLREKADECRETNKHLQDHRKGKPSKFRDRLQQRYGDWAELADLLGNSLDKREGEQPRLATGEESGPPTPKHMPQGPDLSDEESDPPPPHYVPQRPVIQQNQRPSSMFNPFQLVGVKA